MANYKDTLLISPDAIKTGTYINYNVEDGVISNTIRRAQNVYLKEIIGKHLLDRILELEYKAICAQTPNIDSSGYTAYNTLLKGYIKPYLAAKTQLDILVPISLKIRNIGAGNAESDTNVGATTIQNINYLRATFKTEVCEAANDLIKFLEDNKEAYPELEGCPCKGKNNMMGERFVNTGLWLGGK